MRESERQSERESERQSERQSERESEAHVLWMGRGVCPSCPRARRARPIVRTRGWGGECAHRVLCHDSSDG